MDGPPPETVAQKLTEAMQKLLRRELGGAPVEARAELRSEGEVIRVAVFAVDSDNPELLAEASDLRVSHVVEDALGIGPDPMWHREGHLLGGEAGLVVHEAIHEWKRRARGRRRKEDRDLPTM